MTAVNVFDNITKDNILIDAVGSFKMILVLPKPQVMRIENLIPLTALLIIIRVKRNWSKQ